MEQPILHPSFSHVNRHLRTSETKFHHLRQPRCRLGAGLDLIQLHLHTESSSEKGCSNQCRRDQLIVLGHQKEKNKKPRRLSKAPRRFTLLLSAHRLSPGDPDFPKVYQSGSRFPIAYSRAESP
ncbi:hypothetical protein DTO212C5_3171 [Paecilomyces variotii]|nr:hypothetical protein DTO212C5_3171 [Paecilomyces variotii]KAJ9351796.1 hypothetical protein DTO027B9_6172 [Paecilomyces variotii]